jgi:integrase
MAVRGVARSTVVSSSASCRSDRSTVTAAFRQIWGALREGELFGLLWNCVDLKAGTVTIVRQLTEDLDGNLVLSPLKTKASRRTLELPKLARRALQLLREVRRGEPGNAFVFSDGDGKPLRKSNFIRRDFKPLLV